MGPSHRPGRVRERLAAVVGTEHEDVMLSVAEQLIKQGFDKGLEKALEGQRTMLLRLLGRRFGVVSEHITARVAAATPSELERWFERVLDAASLDDVFASE